MVRFDIRRTAEIKKSDHKDFHKRTYDLSIDLLLSTEYKVYVFIIL